MSKASRGKPVIELRVLTVDDWSVWRELRLAALADAPHAFGSRLADWQGSGDQPDRWRAVLARPNSHWVIAMLEGEPVGMVAGWDATYGAVDLISMWVRPQARGHGVGDALIQAVEQWALDRQAHTLRLFVANDNDRAAALYLRNGFRRPLGGSRRTSDGVCREEYIMMKGLATPGEG